MPTDPTRTPVKTTIYDQEYFSGSQVNLYIGDVLIDECFALEFIHQQRKAPVYGYASQYFDKTMKGVVLVQGSFTVNFKESGYLFTVLKRMNNLRNQRGTNLISPFVSSKNIGKPKYGGARSSGDIGVLTRANIERTIAGEESREDLWQYYQDLTSLHAELSGFNNKEGALNKAEDIFEAFENEIWGQKRFEGEPRTIDDTAFDDFTIYVTYGDFNSNDRINHTARRIDGVRLLSTQQVIGTDGSPVQETYTFLARNLV